MKLYSNEIVFRGHPDKVCDQISDAILDECLKQDKNSRCGIEVMGGKGKIFITGEVTTNAIINVENITKVYTERELFKKASFYVQEKEKIGHEAVEKILSGLLKGEEIKAKDLKLTGYSNKTIENTFKDLQSQVDNALSDINLTQEAVSDKSIVVTPLTLDETNGANFKAENSKIGDLKIDNYSQGNKSEKITNTDTINSAFGKLQSQIDNVENNIGTDKL